MDEDEVVRKGYFPKVEKFFLLELREPIELEFLRSVDKALLLVEVEEFLILSFASAIFFNS